MSFACTFAFGELKLMEGSAKILSLIARDEATHLNLTTHIIKAWQKGDDKGMSKVIKSQDNFTALKDEDREQSIFRRGLDTIVLTFKSVSIFTKSFNQATGGASYFDIPPKVIDTISLIVGIFILFAIVAVFWRYKST